MGKKNRCNVTTAVAEPEEPQQAFDNGRLEWLPPVAEEWPTSRTHRWLTACERYKVTRVETKLNTEKRKGELPGYYGVEFKVDGMEHKKYQPEHDPKMPGTTYARRHRTLLSAIEAAERIHRERTGTPRVASNLDQIVGQAEKDGLDSFEQPEKKETPTVETTVVSKPLLQGAAPTNQQIAEARKQHHGMVLLFRVGDGYAAYDEDADLLEKSLGEGNDRFPIADLEGHLRKLLAAGYRVAICEQVSENNQESACPPPTPDYNNDGDTDEDIFTPEKPTVTETEEAAPAEEAVEPDEPAQPPLRVAPKQVIDLFKEAGWHLAGGGRDPNSWRGKGLLKRINNMHDVDQENWATVSSPAGARLLQELLAAVTVGREIELINDEGDEDMEATAEAPAKRGRPKGSKNKAKAGNGRGEPKVPRKAADEKGGGRKHEVKAGSIINRNYKGKDLVVKITDDGVEFKGKSYSSLTECAKHITGASSISGPRFFGLV